ncbi:MAG: glycogen debranching enzyme [SAR324 cluster bacterium]|nr:glycogen debranching enzyme [SAR324 cluster bacterium]
MQFGLYAEATKIEYYFYADPHQMETNRSYSLLEKVILDKDTFCVGNMWSWEATISEGSLLNQPIGYLLQVWKENPETGQEESHWILDPYAREYAGGETWGTFFYYQIHPENFDITKLEKVRDAHLFSPIRRLPIIRPTLSKRNQTGKVVPRSQKNRPAPPNHPLETSIIYECHLRGMTKSPTAALSNDDYAGTYRGLIEAIPYFKRLGITAVELLPVFDFDENENHNISPEINDRLFNYWGYSSILFFAPKQSYAADPANAVDEFKEMVDAFHEAGLEIILDVVYNHTAEMNSGGPIDHFKWLGEDTYYICSDGHMMNYSGCGNTVNCNHPVVRQFIISSLRYWHNEIGVDGFRFDLTTILDRDLAGNVQLFPSLLWDIRYDSELQNAKLIAEPWDAGGGHQLGHLAYHAQWAEWNDRYRDNIRKALRGDTGNVVHVKNSLLANPDVYQTPQKGRQFSINFITAHDGFTMWDLVSYNEKHNKMNGEDNRDGNSNNISYNCGVEGETKDPIIQALRYKKVRTFHLLLQLSGGIPMLVGGDEFARSQQGNNNPYCLDNEITWIDWNQLKNNQKLFEFVQSVIAFRKANFPLLFSEKSHYDWFNTEGKEEDLEHHVRTLTWLVTHPDFPGKAICAMLNYYTDPLEFYFPESTDRQPGTWHRIFDTAREGLPKQEKIAKSVMVDGFSIQVFEKK